MTRPQYTATLHALTVFLVAGSLAVVVQLMLFFVLGIAGSVLVASAGLLIALGIGTLVFELFKPAREATPGTIASRERAAAVPTLDREAAQARRFELRRRSM
jgi:predicted membrane channel-forming protein YqfA (hemolysin III family)